MMIEKRMEFVVGERESQSRHVDRAQWRRLHVLEHMVCGDGVLAFELRVRVLSEWVLCPSFLALEKGHGP
eukprot:6952659-Pyramimonas_sp.AAC.1